MIFIFVEQYKIEKKKTLSKSKPPQPTCMFCPIATILAFDKKKINWNMLIIIITVMKTEIQKADKFHCMFRMINYNESAHCTKNFCKEKMHFKYLLCNTNINGS